MVFVNLLQAVYTVGTIYCSTVDTSPSSFIGGTWVQITDATLRGATTNGYTGSDTHVQTIEEMPAHNHVDGRVRGGDGQTALRSAYASFSSTSTGHYAPWFGSGYSGVDDVRISTEGGGKLCLLSSAPTIALFGTEFHSFIKYGGDVNGIR